METLPTLVDLLTADLLIALLPSLVIMATLRLEGVSANVNLIAPGVEQLQPVKVSSTTSSPFRTVKTGPIEPPTTCPDLTVPANGIISYNLGTVSPRLVNTVATYTCDTGYTLDGGITTRTCRSDGVWSGFSPDCQRK